MSKFIYLFIYVYSYFLPWKITGIRGMIIINYFSLITLTCQILDWSVSGSRLTSNRIFGLGSGMLDFCRTVDCIIIDNALEICNYEYLFV